MNKNFDKERAHNTFYKLIQTDRLHRCVLDGFLSDFGIHRSQHMILMRLSKEDCCPSQKALAEHFKISPAAIAVTLKKLEESGYILRSSHKDDVRLNNITLTEKGKDIVVICTPKVRHFWRCIFLCQKSRKSTRQNLRFVL